uniref:F-box domain-containing protein n=1 Tax=Panagrolaimus sp. ES5 TaxID=591445 RepID=A0AC34FN50_9BILA
MKCWRTFSQKINNLFFVTPIDLSATEIDVIKEILLQLPKNQIIKCRQVCQRWKKIIDERSFWLDKEKRDGETYLRDLINSGNELFIKDYAFLSIKKPFNKNLLSPVNLNGYSDVQRHADPRWNFIGLGWRYASPPSFLDGHFHPDFQDLFSECQEVNTVYCEKYFHLNLLDHGISPEIVDTFRPPIIFSEYVAHEAETECTYFCQIFLWDGVDRSKELYYESKEIHFGVEQLQKWEKLELVLKSYPPGVRAVYVYIQSSIEIGIFGCKIAGSNLEVKMEESPPPVSKE